MDKINSQKINYYCIKTTQAHFIFIVVNLHSFFDTNFNLVNITITTSFKELPTKKELFINNKIIIIKIL